MSENKLFGKTIIWDGDSLCAGNAIKGNWATRIAERNEMVFKNYAVGGGTVAEGMPDFKSGGKRHCVSITLEKMYKEYPDADYVILEGGSNDADLYVREGKDLDFYIGHVDPFDFGGEYDRTTFAGALESVFFRAVKYWCGKKIGFIIAHKMGPEPDKFRNRDKLFAIVDTVARKWGIPVLDLWHGCYLNPYLPWMYDASLTPEENNEKNEGFYVDGQHLTAKGYDFTSELVETWLKTL